MHIQRFLVWAVGGEFRHRPGKLTCKKFKKNWSLHLYIRARN